MKFTFEEVGVRQIGEISSAMGKKKPIMEIIHAMENKKENMEHFSEYFDKVFFVFGRQSIAQPKTPSTEG